MLVISVIVKSPDPKLMTVRHLKLLLSWISSQGAFAMQGAKVVATYV
jgi:hypothetical protein